MRRVKTKLVHGVGVNDADYNVVRHDSNKKQIWVCPFYKVWRDLLKRCYDEKYRAKNPTYTDCTMVGEWLIFSTFRKWMSNQDWKYNQLDKDLIGDGKHYSPNNCVFISGQLNKFIAIDRSAGELPTGVTLDKRSLNYCAQCVDPTGTFKRHIGTFEDAESAHLAYMVRKHKVTLMLIDNIKDERVKSALRGRYV